LFLLKLQPLPGLARGDALWWGGDPLQFGPQGSVLPLALGIWDVSEKERAVLDSFLCNIRICLVYLSCLWRLR
jgi:hypothetical protein